MHSRRNFIKTGSLAIAGLSLSNLSFTKSFAPNSFETKRPPISERKFVSEAIETKIVEMKKIIKDEELSWLFENCFPNTLDTTITHKIIDGKPDTFVITGDINAMWLRDSSAQVWPCLLYTSDAADERSSVDLGGRRIIKKNKSSSIVDEGRLTEIDALTQTQVINDQHI